MKAGGVGRPVRECVGGSWCGRGAESEGYRRKRHLVLVNSIWPREAGRRMIRSTWFERILRRRTRREKRETRRRFDNRERERLTEIYGRKIRRSLWTEVRKIYRFNTEEKTKRLIEEREM